MTNKNFIISDAEEGIRLDVWLSEKMDDVSRSYVQKLIENGHVTVDGKLAKSRTRTKAGMNVVIEIPEPENFDLEPENIPLDIVYEDQDIIVINKSKDMVVHPAAGNWGGTLVNALLAHCKDSLSDINGVIRPGIVHRIDKDTTGLLVAAKNNFAHMKLAEQIKDHSMKRTYDAIVDGIVKETSGKIDAPIGRHPVNRKKMAIVKNGKPAVTYFEVLEYLRGYTYLRLKLETGRTHQIRVHMAAMGHPVTGDPVYGRKLSIMDTKGQVLHARFLRLIHPRSNEEMVFEAPLPSYFTELLKLLR